MPGSGPEPILPVVSSFVPGWGPERSGLSAAEIEQLRRMSASERLEIMRSLCRDAGRLLAAMDPRIRQSALAHRDKLPESSREALRRLRIEAKKAY